MGDKGVQSPPSYVPPADNSAQFESALNAYKMQSEFALEQNKQMFQNELNALKADFEDYESSLPTILGSEQSDIDWQAKNEELKKKMEAAFNTEQAKKKTRTSTILTSPLLDDEDPITSSSILTGK